jgi:hypothetical protein
MEQLLNTLRSDFPALRFTAGTSFCWAPASQEVLYVSTADDTTAQWSLLHETGHALLGHTTYALDFELLEIEVAAWQKARELALIYDIAIDKNHIEDCLDSYRDWLHCRSLCPSCSTQALQVDSSEKYRCFNCQNTWAVAPSRFCRPYRSSAKAKSPATIEATDDLALRLS